MHSPKLPLIFKEIPFYNNTRENCELCPPSTISNYFSIGYKNMCYFWSIDFLTYFKDYEFVIRIDEDCFLKYMDVNTIQNYKTNNIYYSSPAFKGRDEPTVVIGMEWLFNKYISDNNIIPFQTTADRNPYTNIMIINIDYFNSLPVVKGVLDEIKESNCIFSNRWGDLPIWGHILALLINPRHYIKDANISYFHESHHVGLNC